MAEMAQHFQRIKEVPFVAPVINLARRGRDRCLDKMHHLMSRYHKITLSAVDSGTAELAAYGSGRGVLAGVFSFLGTELSDRFIRAYITKDYLSIKG